MIALNDRLPRYLLEKEQIWTTVVYTALFSLIFILVSIPFSGSAWFALGESDAFIYTLAFVLLSALLIILSRSLMHRCRDLKRFTLLGYIGWNVAEVVVVALLYTVFTRKGMEVGIIDGERESGEIFLSALVYAAVCLCVPFAFCALHFALQDRDNTIRLMNYGNVVSDKPAKPYSDWYMDSAGEMKQYMLRCRLKTVEDSFADSELVRCHRKYIVNIRKISILKSEKEGYKVDFDIDSIDPIPISKTYEQAVLARFNSR